MPRVQFHLTSLLLNSLDPTASRFLKEWWLTLSVYLTFYRESICMNCLFYLALLTESVSLHYFQIRFEMLIWHFGAFFLTWSVKVKNDMTKFVIVNDNAIFRWLFFLETEIIAIKFHMQQHWNQKPRAAVLNEVLVRIIFYSSSLFSVPGRVFLNYYGVVLCVVGFSGLILEFYYYHK